MPIPKYFVLERAKALQEQEKRLGEILAKLGPQEKEGVSFMWQKLCDVIMITPAFVTINYLYVLCGRWPRGHYVSELFVYLSVCLSVHHTLMGTTSYSTYLIDWLQLNIDNGV